MATLYDFFTIDFGHTFKIGFPLTIQSIEHPPKFPAFEIQASFNFELYSNALFGSFYLSDYPQPIENIETVISQIETLVQSARQTSVTFSESQEQMVFHSEELVFTGRLFFYSVADVPPKDFENLRQHARTLGLSIIFRGEKYAVERSKLTKPMAFICHDSRDKKEIAHKVASGLSKLDCPVWYDEYSLKVGDRLRESIEKGLKESKKCILLLSPNFFSNTGWTKTEFNTIFTRELMEKNDCLLPVWCGVSKEEVYEYCPSLVDRFALNWALGEDKVISQLYQALR
jgi:hypothetical protein